MEGASGYPCAPWGASLVAPAHSAFGCAGHAALDAPASIRRHISWSVSAAFQALRDGREKGGIGAVF